MAISVEIAKFPTLCTGATEKLPWNWVTPDWASSVTISLQYTSVTDRRTDGETPANSKYRTYA